MAKFNSGTKSYEDRQREYFWSAEIMRMVGHFVPVDTLDYQEWRR